MPPLWNQMEQEKLVEKYWLPNAMPLVINVLRPSCSLRGWIPWGNYQPNFVIIPWKNCFGKNSLSGPCPQMAFSLAGCINFHTNRLLADCLWKKRSRKHCILLIFKRTAWACSMQSTLSAITIVYVCVNLDSNRGGGYLNPTFCQHQQIVYNIFPHPRVWI